QRRVFLTAWAVSDTHQCRLDPLRSYSLLHPFPTRRSSDLITLVVIYPLVWLFASTFKPNSEFGQNQGLIPLEPTLQNYATIMERSEEHTSELQSRENLVCRLQLEKKNSDGSINLSLSILKR